MTIFPGLCRAAQRCLHAPTAGLLSALLVGCGGGGSGGDASNMTIEPPPAATAPPTAVASPSEAPAVPAKEASPPADAKPVCSVTLEGDSILYGGYAIHHRLPEPPAAALQRMRPAYTVIDHSANGSMATLRAPIFARLPLTTRFVVLEHGINDGAFGLAWGLELALRSMVAHVQAEGATPIVTGLARQPRTAPGRDAVDAIVQRVAAETGALFADWGAVPFEPHEMADALHPGPAYSARLVQRIVAVLDAAAPECAH